MATTLLLLAVSLAFFHALDTFYCFYWRFFINLGRLSRCSVARFYGLSSSPPPAVQGWRQAVETTAKGYAGYAGYEEVQTAEGEAFFAIVIRRRLEQFCSCYVYINVSIRHCLPCQPLFPPNPETVYRFPYSVCRIPYARLTPLPSLTPFPFPFPYFQLHSTSSLVPTMLLLWVFSSLFFRFFLIYQLQSVMWLTFGNTGSINQRLVTLFCGHSDRSVNHSLIKLNLIADKVKKKKAS